MKIQLLGAAREVGRSCILVDDRFLFDAGIMIQKTGTMYPEEFPLKKVEAVFLSHAHLDHSGALPYFYQRGMQRTIFATKMTKELAVVLLRDSFKVEKLTEGSVPYTEEEVTQALDLVTTVSYRTRGTFDDVKYTFLSSGHIPGSASICLEINKRKILYTGDICLNDSKLLAKASYVLDDVDIVITESTYGDRNHPSRKAEEKRFLTSVRTVIENGGSVIVPVFAVGRAQELMMILAQEEFDVPMYLDGMARLVSAILLKKPETVRDGTAFREACKKFQFVKSLNKRKKAAQQQGIFVTTSGMVEGGPVLEYIKHLYTKKNNALFATGYQDPESNGYKLLHGDKIEVDRQVISWKGSIDKFDFSAHADQKDLIEFIKKLHPKHVVIQHGDEEACLTLQRELQKVSNAEIHVPRLKEVLDL